MDDNTKLTCMANVPQGEINIFKFPHGEMWSVVAKGHNDGINYQVNGNAETFSSAVDQCYLRWIKLTDRMPELVGALPPPSSNMFHPNKVIDHE